MNNSTYTLLASLIKDPRYKVLQEEWIKAVSKIEENRDRAAARGAESAWRYYAGMEKGFKNAMLTLEVSLAALESDEQEGKPSELIEKLLSSAAGETK